MRRSTSESVTICTCMSILYILCKIIFIIPRYSILLPFMKKEALHYCVSESGIRS